MPSLKKSLGSLAAVAALAPAQEAAAATIFSPFSNVPAVGSIDIDGNGSIDFSLNSQGAFEGVLANNGTAINGLNPEIFPPGFSSVNASFTFNQSLDISSVIDPDPKYIGVRFDRAGATHYGYLAFHVLTTFDDGTLLGGGWQTTPENGASVQQVPEPKTLSLMAAGLALLTARQRRKDNDAE